MPEKKILWRTWALCGLGIIVLGAAAFTAGALSMLPSGISVYDSAILVILIGLAILLTCLIGWAAQLGRKGRTRLAVIAFAPPVLVAAIGFLSTPNVHGIFPLFFLAAVPLVPTGIILGIMAARARRP